jgi:hypothetical protein
LKGCIGFRGIRLALVDFRNEYRVVVFKRGSRSEIGVDDGICGTN